MGLQTEIVAPSASASRFSLAAGLNLCMWKEGSGISRR